MRALLLLLLPTFAFADDKAATFKNLQIHGDIATRDKGVQVVGKSANVILDANDGGFRAVVEVTLSPKGLPIFVAAFPEQPRDLAKPGLSRVSIGRDLTGYMLIANAHSFDPDAKTWSVVKGAGINFPFWPSNPKAKNDIAALEKLGLKEQFFYSRPIRLAVEGDDVSITYWLEGLLIHEVPRAKGHKGAIVVQLANGDVVHHAGIEPVTRNPLYLPIDLTSHANDRLDKIFPKPRVQAGAVPFDVVLGEKNLLSLKQAGWPEAGRDPSSYYEKYDGGPAILHDPRTPFLRVPLADYAAVHVLAVADDSEDFTNSFTVQAGKYGYAQQVVQYDFFGQVPRLNDPARKLKPLDTPAGKLFQVRVPLDLAFAQDLERSLEITLTKEIRLARRAPDPCRFRYRPLGLPSGVRIAALTLERAPLQMRVTSKFTGHAFEEPETPKFDVRLTNITATDQAYHLLANVQALDGGISKNEQPGKIEAGKSQTVEIATPVKKRGYHDITLTLANAAKQPVLNRRTSFALLPPDTRKFRHLSPFGTWDFCGGHYTSNDPDRVGPLYVKLGLRFGMFGFPEEARKKYGILKGSEPTITGKGLEVYEKFRADSPDSPPVALLFHEHSISGKHVTRTPDFFHDFPPYKLDEAEEKRFQEMWDEATTAAKALRAKYPHAHIRLGNGPIPLREEFYRKKFPAELFDSAGNESASFGRPPEAQPPDWIANNASLWMDRQLLDAYGYRDKGVSQCYEVCYPACNPGNLTLRKQADYLVRHAMHALAWGIKEFRPGCISDMGNSYYYSNWGATGFCNKKPELSVKPSFVSFATMTRVLDGARFNRVLELGSPSLYGMEFDLPDGSRAYSFWTMEGKRPLKLQMDGGPWREIDDQSNERPLTPTKAAMDITVSPSPIYVVGKGKFLEAAASPPVYTAKPAGKATVLTPLTSLDDWTVEPTRNAELEMFTFITPRRKGNFVYGSPAKLDGKPGALQISPLAISHGKETMPMYSVLVHKEGLPVPGTPTEIGLWIHGNSGWGRIIYELTDAKGQRWISLGSQQSGEPTAWLADWLPKDQLSKPGNAGQSDWNTEDVFGLSRIHHDGWRYVPIPLPGNYPGEKYPWPANSQWRWDKDGVVRYPLTLRKVIVELNEKVLHVKTYAPPPRADIAIRDLTVGQGDVVRLKRVAWEERD